MFATVTSFRQKTFSFFKMLIFLDRLAAYGAHTGVPGVAKIGLSYGYFSRDVASLQLLFGHTLTEAYFRRVPLTVPLPFASNNHGLERVPLRIGYTNCMFGQN